MLAIRYLMQNSNLVEEQPYTFGLGSVLRPKLLLTQPHHQRYLSFFHV